MTRVDFLFDILTIYQTIEDCSLNIDTDSIISIDKLFENENFKQTYLYYRNQFNTKKCIDDTIVQYIDKENNNRNIDIVDIILDLLYNSQYLSLYQMLYIMRCINDKLNNILFKNVLYNKDEGYLYEIIEQEIY